MGRYGKLLRRLEVLEVLEDASFNFDDRMIDESVTNKLDARLRYLECTGHEWLFVSGYHGGGNRPYSFKCNRCDKTVHLLQYQLFGTMRPQLEVLGYLKPEKEKNNE